MRPGDLVKFKFAMITGLGVDWCKPGVIVKVDEYDSFMDGSIAYCDVLIDGRIIKDCVAGADIEVMDEDAGW